MTEAEPQEPRSIGDFTVGYLGSLEAGLRELAEVGVNPQVAVAVEAFLDRVSAQTEEDALKMAAAFGLGVMLATAMQRPEVLERPDLLRALGLHYTAACLSSVWPEGELEPVALP